LSITKNGQKEPSQGTFINYIITVTNDGNRALGPVYVQDLLPTGTEYVYSSARPSSITQDSVEWTLLNLGIGASNDIELKINITQDTDGLINRVKASGGYDGQWIVAENYSAIQLGWLSCCPPQLLSSKEGFVDSNDSTLVHYRIILKNRERETMVATITDQLPSGMTFLNSSQTPSDHSSDRVSWNILDLRPGEMKAIDYWARALHGGAFVNQAHIDAQYLNGTDSAVADIACRVYVQGELYSPSGSSWQPPECFGLNCTSQNTADAEEWMPCNYCGVSSPGLLDMTTCESCESNEE
jgi:large repetitive protein